MTGAPVLIGVDGRSGCGKTTLAAALAERLRRYTPVRTLLLDELYPGWDGLAAVTADDGPYLTALRRLARGQAAEMRTWDWQADGPGHAVTLEPAEAVLVEGVGALCSAARPLLTLGVWLDCADGERRHRALSRDGEDYAPHWERWARQEEQYLRAHRPQDAAHLRLRLC